MSRVSSVPFPSDVGQNVQYPWRREGFWISLLAPDWSYHLGRFRDQS